MQTSQRPAYPRHNTYHGAKKGLLGNHSGMPAPAWKAQHIPAKAQAARQQNPNKTHGGSKIFLANLPKDVGQEEVEELFRKTIGPVEDVFLVYNSQGNPKGMAIVSFTRPTDAAAARAKYHGKIVDGRTSITVELIVPDATSSGNTASAPAPLNSLAARLAPAANGKPPATKNSAPKSAPTKPIKPGSLLNRVGPPMNAPKTPKGKPVPVAPKALATPHVSAKRARTKKGPKRVQKIVKKTVNQLDQEMEDYRAAVAATGDDAAMAS